eukprot:5975179-Amphidinium_carterae.2
MVWFVVILVQELLTGCPKTGAGRNIKIFFETLKAQATHSRYAVASLMGAARVSARAGQLSVLARQEPHHA